MSSNTIETGVETDNHEIRTSDADLMYFIDNGEYAEIAFVERLDETTVEVNVFFAEAGHREFIMCEPFGVDANTETKEWAKAAANADPQFAIEQARKHFDN